MAKGKYKEWITERGITVLSTWARLGLTDENIASNIGIHVGTLYEWKNKHNEICEALKHTKNEADAIVENALYMKACGGDITAMIFWLKNRQPDRWREKRHEEEKEYKATEVLELISSISKGAGKPKKVVEL